MLVEFSVENYRVFRDKQRFSMVTSKASANSSSAKSLLTNNAPSSVVHTKFKVAPYILKQSCVFGANGAGKSTLVEAMCFMSEFVTDCLRNTDRKEIDVTPFGIDEPESRKPTSFEVVFIHKNRLYHYGFGVTRERVEEEWLVARSLSTQRIRQYFHREYDEESDSYHWEVNHALIPREQKYWRTITRPSALFLSTAVQFEKSGLEDAFEWFVFNLRFILMSHGLRPDITAGFLKRDGWKQKFLTYFKSVGVLLHDIDVTEIDLSENSKHGRYFKRFEEQHGNDRPSEKTYLIDFVRQGSDKQLLTVPFDAESIGVQTLFELVGPLLDTLDKGHTLVLDEFNSNLHPLAFREIILMFSDPDLNPENAQLIFTSHDVTVTEYEEIGRDQIWLIEKKPDLSSTLYPLSSFKKRRDKLFRNDYLSGRYGGIPLIM